ncbi:cell division ATP-binding protein FtsE [Planctomonas psychrotolerans]|uniref:cell division ATP-binding protein FtsE n=1 Tax=Planctomonas psychrotolerans TaxID=2528712 RepID=UPI001238F509|nr:cell division ATP-binding protein FtsE [Planctomonas psychrotolerans]
MIRFDNVSKVYAGTQKPALDSVDLEILRGEFVFLVGASGSGKSSFLRLVLKEDKPTAGAIHVLGQQLSQLSSRKVPYYRRRLGVVFQDFRLLPNKSVFDNVAFTLQVIGKSKGFIQEAVPDVLKMVGLAGKAQRLPHELSGGEQQRVAIARAVVNKPAILLADEPTGNLDPATSAGIMQVLDRINADGTTVVMATHDAGIVDSMQRRVIELIGGHIVRDERRGAYVTTSIPVQRVGTDTSPIFIPQPEEPVGVFGPDRIISPASPIGVRRVDPEEAVATTSGTPEPSEATADRTTTDTPARTASPATAPAPAAATASSGPETGSIRRLPDGTGAIGLPTVTGATATSPAADGPGLQELTLAEKLGLRKASDTPDDTSSQDVGPTS